jgi:hypothetical protein
MSFKTIQRAQLSGRPTWFVVGDDGLPVCECASPVWASVIATSLRRDLIIENQLFEIDKALKAIKQGIAC